MIKIFVIVVKENKNEYENNNFHHNHEPYACSRVSKVAVSVIHTSYESSVSKRHHFSTIIIRQASE